MSQSLGTGAMETVPLSGGARAGIRRVAPERPWGWLAEGWRDFLAAPGFGIAYGFLFTVGGALLTWLFWLLDIFWSILPIAAGFMLVAPVLAVGLYDTSRRLMLGERVTSREAFHSWIPYVKRLAPMGLVLTLFLLAWVRVAQLVFALFFSQNPPRPDPLYVVDVFLSPTSIPFLVVGFAIGGVLAGFVFAISVVSIPAMVDRDINVVSAIGLSLRVVRRNFWVMALWAWLIALFAGAGIATLYLGLMVTLPILGHATWHAYRDLVVWED
jgi:uncharacterized membrane protein